MSGETDLQILLERLNPKVHDHRFVFAHIPKGQPFDWSTVQPMGMFQEHEGTTLILEHQNAQSSGLSYETVFACITLQIHSSLNAVGLTAAVCDALAKENISANMVAAYYHDHIFVPETRTQDALRVLKKLSREP